jgi:hypothetical protein
MVFGKEIDGYGFYAMELVRKWIYGFAMDWRMECNGYW